MAQAQLDGDLRRAKLEEVLVRFRVVADRVPAGGGFFHQVGTFTDEAANYEKCRFGLIAVEQVQEFWRDGGIRAIVKGDGKLARRIGSANRAPEKLRAREERAVGGNASRSKHGRWHGNEERIHALILARWVMRL